MSKIKNEPVIAAALAVIASFIGLLVAFGITVTPAEKEAIHTFADAIFVLALLVRQRVTPTHKVGTHV